MVNCCKYWFILVILCLHSFMFVEGKVKNQNRDDKHIHSNNPVEKYNIAWTDDFHWDRVFSMEDARGETANAKFEYAQNQLLKSGGGVVYFPAGTYHFLDHIKLKSGIIIRGAEPVNSEKHNPIVPEEYPEPFIDAREPRYTLGTYFRFPEYNPVFEGTGTNINTAFKGIRLANPENANFCGVVNIDIDHGHIALGEKQAMTENYKNGVMNGNFLVYGCILTNTAVADTLVPYDFQHPWQRWIDRNYAAITIFGCKNILVANNRIPENNPVISILKHNTVAI